MSGLVQNKVAFVTGGGSGIGRAASLIFAREGARVAVADVALPGAEETVRLIKETGGEAIAMKMDVRRSVEIESAIAEILKTYGRLDCAFNNAAIAGWHGPQDTQNISEEEWDDVVNISMKGVWLCMKYEIPQMLKQGKGAIVNTASVMAIVAGEDGNYPYYASKHGVAGLTKAAALKYAKSGIRVNAICPGPTATPTAVPALKTMTQEEIEKFVNAPMNMAPIGRWAKPQEIAEPAVWLCSDAASYVTGHMMAVDGGILAR